MNPLAAILEQIASGAPQGGPPGPPPGAAPVMLPPGMMPPGAAPGPPPGPQYGPASPPPFPPPGGMPPPGGPPPPTGKSAFDLVSQAAYLLNLALSQVDQASAEADEIAGLAQDANDLAQRLQGAPGAGGPTRHGHEQRGPGGMLSALPPYLRNSLNDVPPLPTRGGGPPGP